MKNVHLITVISLGIRNGSDGVSHRFLIVLACSMDDGKAIVSQIEDAAGPIGFVRYEKSVVTYCMSGAPVTQAGMLLTLSYPVEDIARLEHPMTVAMERITENILNIIS